VKFHWGCHRNTCAFCIFGKCHLFPCRERLRKLMHSNSNVNSVYRIGQLYYSIGQLTIASVNLRAAATPARRHVARARPISERRGRAPRPRAPGCNCTFGVAATSAALLGLYQRKTCVACVACVARAQGQGRGRAKNEERQRYRVGMTQYRERQAWDQRGKKV
jgi:hypothetical protein